MRILLAEDEPDTAAYVARGLSEAGHNPVLAHDGKDALHLGLTEDFDLMVLDRMMPGLDGVEVLRRLRAGGIAAPAIMLTALGRIEDRVAGLDAGADDYLVKPFAFSELLARVNAISRRSAPQQAVTRLAAGPFVLDLLSREVRRDGVPILLQPKEFRLLEELMRNAGEYVTRTMLLERVWDFHFDDSSLRSQQVPPSPWCWADICGGGLCRSRRSRVRLPAEIALPGRKSVTGETSSIGRPPRSTLCLIGSPRLSLTYGKSPAT